MPVNGEEKELPFVSIVTCSYKRAKFLPNMLRMVARQDYPHDKMEWIIIDDSPDEDNSHIFPDNGKGKLDGIQVYYKYLKTKIPLAKKRDLLNMSAKGKYIINMDDDDYYPPCRVSHCVEKLEEAGTDLAGSSKMYMYFSNDKKIVRLGPYRENHGTAATMAYTKSYADKHFFYNPHAENGKGHYAEEGVFTEGWIHKMVQLDSMKTVLALSHTDNTIEKTMFRDEKHGHVGRTVHPTEMKLEEFIDKEKEKDVYDFYDTLEYEYKVNEYTETVLGKMKENADQAAAHYNNQMMQRMANDINLARLNLQKQALYDPTVRL